MSNTTKLASPMKVITGKDTRWSYANVWEAKSINGGTPKFSVSLIIPKADTATVQKVKAAIQTVTPSALMIRPMLAATSSTPTPRRLPVSSMPTVTRFCPAPKFTPACTAEPASTSTPSTRTEIRALPAA